MVDATAEQGRLTEAPEEGVAWRRWGPNLSGRQWIEIAVSSRGPERATLHVLPTLRFRSAWSRVDGAATKPSQCFAFAAQRWLRERGGDPSAPAAQGPALDRERFHLRIEHAVAMPDSERRSG
jgi:hypothetical protein